MTLESPDVALVAFGRAVQRVALGATLAGPARVAVAPGGVETKSPATCPACDFLLVVAWERKRTPLLRAPRDGSGPAVVARRAVEGERLKHLAVDPSGRRAWVTDKRGGAVLELAVDPTTGEIGSERRWLEIAEPYDVTVLPGGEGLLVTDHADRLRHVDLAGRVLATWDVAAACGYATEWNVPLRAAKRDPRTGATYVLNHRSVLRLDPTPDGEGVASCTLVAGDPVEKGFAEGCGARARFASPHDLELVEDGRALWVSDTRNDALRRVSLEPGPGYGCTRTVRLGAPLD
jgi:hypothetical protein